MVRNSWGQGFADGGYFRVRRVGVEVGRGVCLTLFTVTMAGADVLMAAPCHTWSVTMNARLILGSRLESYSQS